MFTIGIPIFNEEKYLGETIDSAILAGADEIILLDNASTDKSQEICLEYTRKFNFIRYYRNNKTVSVFDNFEKCLTYASQNSEYFMFLGAHDYIPANYKVELEKSFINEEVMLAFPKVIRYFSEDVNKVNHTYDYFYSKYLSVDNPIVRILSIAEYLTQGALFHGIYKTKVLKSIYLNMKKNYIGSLHVFMCRLAATGKLVSNCNTFYYRREVRKIENSFERNLRYLKYMNYSLELLDIYTDVYREMREGHISSIELLDNVNDKDFWLKILERDMMLKRASPITVAEYKDYFELHSVRIINNFISEFGVKSVIILGKGVWAKEMQSLFNRVGFGNVRLFESKELINYNESDADFDYTHNESWILSSIEGFHDFEIIKNLKRTLNMNNIISWKSLILYFYTKE